MSFVKTGSPKQAKYAVRCIDAMCRSKDVIFKQLFEVCLHVCIRTLAISSFCTLTAALECSSDGTMYRIEYRDIEAV